MNIRVAQEKQKETQMEDPEVLQEEPEKEPRKRKYSNEGFSIYSDQPNYGKYRYCPYSGEELDEEEV